MKFLVVSNMLFATEQQLQILEDTRFSYCIFLGDVSATCMKEISHVVGCDSYAIFGDQNVETTLPQNTHCLHNKCFSFDDKKIGGFQYSAKFEEKDSWKDDYVDICLMDVDVLFTHHSPIIKIDHNGFAIMPDYVKHLIDKTDPKLNICGHEQQNSIGSIQRYKHDPVKVINVNGIAIIQTNNELQIDKLIML